MLKSVVALAALSLCSIANAGTVLFSEDFDSITANTLQITTTAGSMTVTGAVDAVVPVNPFGIVGLTSTVIDLDGSPGPGTLSAGGFNLIAGRTYTLDFVLGGAQRGSASDGIFARLLSSANGDLFGISGTGVFSGFGGLNLGSNFAFSNVIAGSAPFASSSLTFRANNNTTLGFQIGTDSRNNIGPLLDSVTLTQNVIPEPTTWAMLIAGFGLVGTAMRRRRAAVAA
jgi:hypothetical protein